MTFRFISLASEDLVIKTNRIAILLTQEAKAEIEAWAQHLGFHTTSEYIRALVGQHMGAGDDRRLWQEKPDAPR